VVPNAAMKNLHMPVTEPWHGECSFATKQAYLLGILRCPKGGSRPFSGIKLLNFPAYAQQDTMDIQAQVIPMIKSCMLVGMAVSITGQATR